MHVCITPLPSSESTRGLNVDYEARDTPSLRSLTGYLQKTFKHDNAVRSNASPPKCTEPSSSSSSPTITNDYLDDDTNAPAFLPPVIKHLTHAVRRAKERHRPYNWKHPRTMELCFAEKYIGPTNMDPVDVQRGKVLVEHGLKHLSCEAIAQAVLMKEADLEWKHLRLAHIIHKDKAKTYSSATSEPFLSLLERLANSDLGPGELQSCMAFTIAAYSDDKSLYSTTDAQLDQLKHLACEHYHSESVEYYMPASPTYSDSVSSSGEDDSRASPGLVCGIAEILMKSDD
ncbi:hypothetical protein BDR07DRAFT_1476324 [Suillus spraguei]|nr:hypothetical protein BDR07DRAFT_1476324 [Suillus spraguei]